MPRNITQYSLLISCPGDITDEIQIIEKCVAQFNSQFSDSLGITIIARHWSKDSYAQSGGKPQALLNKQFINDCDAAVAIFWTRFGTPTDKYGSGTEEEIETMLTSGKQVFMYFSDRPISPSHTNSKDYERVQEFKNKYKDKGLYFTYLTCEAFERMFFAHLTQHFLTVKKVDELKKERSPELKLLGLDSKNHINEFAYYSSFVPCVEMDSSQYIEHICGLVNEISKIKLQKSDIEAPASYLISSSYDKPVEVNEADQKLIEAAAEILGIELGDDFFCLGDLSRCALPLDVFGGRPVSGSEQEKKKYNLINSLAESIRRFSEWKPIEKILSVRKCIKLILQNSGTAIDEDVEISLKIPRACMQRISFPELNTSNKEYMIKEYSINEMFGIYSTSEFLDYDSSVVRNKKERMYQPSLVTPPFSPDYDIEFKKALKCAFCYEIYDVDEYVIVKLKVDYIKHNTSVAFPTVIFLQDPVSCIEYTITSKNSPEVVTGTITIKKNNN